MADEFDFLQGFIARENGQVKVMRTIRDLEDVLEWLTKIQDTFRNEKGSQRDRAKDELDHLIRILISMASAVYARELKNI